LLEGVHCTYLLQDERFNNRKMILRLHNVEYKYYRQLFHSCHSLFRKIYYLNESRLLKQYETKHRQQSIGTGRIGAGYQYLPKGIWCKAGSYPARVFAVYADIVS
jgi:hypothetical protein